MLKSLQESFCVATPKDVTRLIEALETDDHSTLKEIHDSYPTLEFYKRIPSHNNDTILHLIYRYTGKVMYESFEVLSIFSTPSDEPQLSDEEFKEALFQPNDFGFTPIHYCLMYATFEDAENLVCQCLDSADDEDNKEKVNYLDRMFALEKIGTLIQQCGQKSEEKLSKEELDDLTGQITERLNQKFRESCVYDQYINLLRVLHVLGSGISSDDHVNNLINMESMDLTGSTPLLIAMQRECEKNIQYLVDHGANINAVDIRLKSTLSYCIRFKETIPWLQYFLDMGADVNVGDCIHVACEEGYTEAVELLLKLRSDLDVCSFDSEGNSVFVCLVKHEHDKVFDILNLILPQALKNLEDEKEKLRCLLLIPFQPPKSLNGEVLDIEYESFTIFSKLKQYGFNHALQLIDAFIN